MATTKRPAAKKADSTRAKAASVSDAVIVAPKDNKSLMTLARDLRSWTDFVLGIANTAADLSFRVAGIQTDQTVAARRGREGRRAVP